MAYGKSLELRYVGGPTIEYIIQHPEPTKGDLPGQWVRPKGMESHVNESKDRSLAGKARRLARKAAR